MHPIAKSLGQLLAVMDRLSSSITRALAKRLRCGHATVTRGRKARYKHCQGVGNSVRARKLISIRKVAGWEGTTQAAEIRRLGRFELHHSKDRNSQVGKGGLPPLSGTDFSLCCLLSYLCH